MPSWQEKRAQAEIYAIEKELQSGGGGVDDEACMAKDVRAAAMGGGDEELFEKKMTKEEKKVAKAAAKAAREAKKMTKSKSSNSLKKSKSSNSLKKSQSTNSLKKSKHGKNIAEEKKEDYYESMSPKERRAALALDKLSEDNIVVTIESKRGKMQANTRDINVGGVSVHFHGKPLILETDVVINYGNRYGFLGPNGSGKSTVMKAIAARAIPIPESLDIYFLDKEYEASDTITALQAVCESSDEINDLEQRAEEINTKIAALASGEAVPENGDSSEEAQVDLTQELESVYERLEEMDISTAEARASTILHGLGFTQKMQNQTTNSFSGGWRMRVALARALFIKPEFLLLDEPTNHLDMEAVLWLEEYLAEWDKILFFVCHSQDFMNNVCTHIVRLDATYKKLRYFSGNYDSYVKARRDQDMVQQRQYDTEQREIQEIKDFIARFGHGTIKMVRQSQSREKLLAKKLEAGLTLIPEQDPEWDWAFPDPGKLPVPVLAIEKLSFNYPGGDTLYNNVDFGVDLDTRVALVGPNGAGKTTLFKLMTDVYQPTKGQIKRNSHLKISVFSQHSEDKLDLSKTPIDFFKHTMPGTPIEKIRALLARYGTSGDTQSQTMDQLSGGQRARIVFALIAWEKPHLLMLDEPTNPLDMESIDALAVCLKKFKGGVIMISHDMRLISQCAQEIYICDNKKITKYKGDIMDFKMKTKKDTAKKLTQHSNG